MSGKPKSEERRIAEFWGRVHKTNSCWLWKGAMYSSGYGVSREPDTGRQTYAHRVAYALLIGAIQKHLQIDHLCRVRCCVNPAHMELVTSRVNTLRGNSMSAVHARKTHCPRGHEYNEKNTYRDSKEARHCRKCGARNARRYRQERK